MNKILLLAFIAIIGATIYMLHSEKINGSLKQSRNQLLFSQWMIQYGKKYSTKEETQMRLQIFSKNLEFIQDYNENNSDGIVLTINQFADLSFEEFKAIYLNGLKKDQQSNTLSSQNQEPLTQSLPSSINWVSQGAVTPIKNQGSCGSCWAFSTCGGLEGIYAIRSKNLTSFSPQQIVSCSHNGGNEGCNGGDLPPAYDYVVKYGIESWTGYPYTGTDSKCAYNSSKVIFTPSGYVNVSANNCFAMQQAVVNQPLSVCIEADSNVFQFYTSGVISSSSCGTSLDHCVTLVGYNTNVTSPYWIIKNSWGQTWGQQGYGWIQFSNSTNNKGICGICEEAAYPTWSGK